MPKPYQHHSLVLDQDNTIVFTSFSKRNFFLRSKISKYVLETGQTPISPFLNFDYNLAGLVEQDVIRVSNNTLIGRSDELWVFGEVSDGVLTEIYIALSKAKKVRYFAPHGDTFEEIDRQHVNLEDVSPWMWDWVQAGKNLERWHPRLRFKKTYPLVYPAYSKKNFYLQMHISQFCLQNRMVPLNPFMLFRYFLGDTVPRDTVYRANNNILRICDEVWTFGDIADGVLAEIKLSRSRGHLVRYFKIIEGNPVVFRRTSGEHIPFELPELEQYRQLLH